MGGCLGRVNCFGAGRSPDNGKGDKSRCREALRQRWRPGRAPAPAAEMMRVARVNQRRELPCRFKYWSQALAGGRV